MEKLILLHGAIGSETTFTALKTHLEKNFEVHTLNFPGHGDSKNIDTEFSIGSFSSFVTEYIRSLTGEAVNILGYSLGGYVALNIAHSNPSLIRKVMTFGTIFDWNTETAAKQSAMLNAEKIELKVPAFAQSLNAMHGEKWKEVLSKTSSMLTALGNDKALTEEVLGSINQPVCISVGDRDTIVSIEESIWAYRSLKNSSMIVFPGAGHTFEKADPITLSLFIHKFFIQE